MKVTLKNREIVKLENMVVSETFVLVHSTQLHEVIDLTQLDVFTDSLVLRSDLVYVLMVDSGIVTALPRRMEVEKVEVEITEI